MWEDKYASTNMCFMFLLQIILIYASFANILPLSECCQYILVQYNPNSTHAYEVHPDIFQVFEIQPEPFNERSYYVGTVSNYHAIGFSDCGAWMIKSRNSGSVNLKLS